MLSILIPIYNFDVRTFVTELHLQSKDANVLFEIILIDDASNISFQELNKELENLEFVKYIQLKKNIGRSKIRNLLAKHAKYNYLLFADCDSEILQNNYIKSYLANCKGEVIICGGRNYKNNPPKDRATYFRWYYGKNREVKNANERSKFANRSFMTNNYVISKAIHNTIKFDENISQYGHEDTLFGIELQRKQINIKHIDNPLTHIGLENCKEFINKTKKGINNLNYLIKNYDYPELFEDIKLLRIYKKTKFISFLFKFSFKIFQKNLEKNLCGKSPNLKLFDFYKLAYLHSIK